MLPVTELELTRGRKKCTRINGMRTHGFWNVRTTVYQLSYRTHRKQAVGNLYGEGRGNFVNNCSN